MAGIKGMKGSGGARAGAGRKRLPTNIKRLKGTLQPSRTPAHAPATTAALGEAPAYMSESAKQAWVYAVAHAPAGLLGALDAAVLERWANCAGLYREALAKINQAGVGGMIIKTPSGVLKRSPLMDVIRDLALEMKGYESEMGFTPASRSRVQLMHGAGAEPDPWAELARLAR